DSRAIASLDFHSPGVKAPLRNLLFARGDIDVFRNDGIEADSLNAVGSEIETRPILRPISKACRVNEEPGLCFVIPFRARAGYALLVSLIENDVSFGNDLIGRVIHGDFVSLQPI